MSCVLSIYLRDGIVMAADSRILYTTQQHRDDNTIIQIGIGQTDTASKIVVTSNNVGISYFGVPEVAGAPLSYHVEKCVSERLSNRDLKVRDIAQIMLEYFREQPGDPDVGFHISGYDYTPDGNSISSIWNAHTQSESMMHLNADGLPGISWSGEGDILARLIGPCGKPDADDNYLPLPTYDIPIHLFTLADAVEFAEFAIRTTAETMRYQARMKTVGGPIDILVITRQQAYWAKKKNTFNNGFIG